MSTIADELQALAPSAKLEFFVLDATGLGADIERFHNGTNALSHPVIWQGQQYLPVPIDATGFEVRSDGPRPRPVLTIGDVFGLVGVLARTYRNLQGARLTRRRTHTRFLDAVNFAGGVNLEADPTAQYPDELWIVDRLRSRDGVSVSWELASPLDLEDVLLPARQVRNTLCTWGYRSPECGYAGPPVAKADDTPTSNPAQDVCSRRVSGCTKRFGQTAELPIGIFPGVGTLRQL